MYTVYGATTALRRGHAVNFAYGDYIFRSRALKRALKLLENTVFDYVWIGDGKKKPFFLTRRPPPVTIEEKHTDKV